MKALLASLALAFVFATGAVYAGNAESGSDDSGCHHYKKWEDT